MHMSDVVADHVSSSRATRCTGARVKVEVGNGSAKRVIKSRNQDTRKEDIH